MRLTLNAMRGYTGDLNSVTDEAVSSFVARARAAASTLGDPAGWDDATREEFRAQVADLMSDTVDTYGAATSGMASNFFEQVLEQQGEDVSVPVEDVQSAMAERLQKSSRYHAKSLYRADDPDAGFDEFIDSCTQVVARHVRHSADDTILATANGKGRRTKLRYARVPSGPSCGFCIMLASRGFVYLTRESAGEFSRWHDHCDCTVVAGMPGLEVEGYDWKGMRERYDSCRSALGSNDDLWGEWEALPREEKARYGRGKRTNVLPDDVLAKVGDQADAFNDWVAHRITAEMDTRDRQWLYDGTVPALEREKGARPIGHEWRCGQALQRNGYKVRYRRPTNDGRTSDIYFISGDERSPVETRWEIKDPDGNSPKTVKNQIKKCAGVRGKETQSPNLVISNVRSDITFEEMCSQCQAVFDAGDFPAIKQVIITDKSGEQLRKFARE